MSRLQTVVRPVDHGAHDQGQEHSNPVLTPGFGGGSYMLDYDTRALRFLPPPLPNGISSGRNLPSLILCVIMDGHRGTRECWGQGHSLFLVHTAVVNISGG